MKQDRRFVVWLLIGSLLGSGCLDAPSDKGGEDDPDGPGPTVRERLIGDHPLPEPDGARAHAWLDAYVSDRPYRLTGTPTEREAARYLAATLEGIGYEVTELTFPHPTAGIPHPAGHVLRVVIGTLPGTTQPDRWLAWGAHYDSVTTTIEGAYDNGSGTALAIELAHMLKEVQTERTRAVLFFNGEEQGRQASEAYMQWYATQNDFEIELYIGLDMVGIAYPAPGRPLAFYAGATHGIDLVRLAQEAAWDLLGFPDDHEAVTFADHHTRGSDEVHFERAGIATIRFAGLQQNTDYWGYHRVNDTMETIHEMTGGPENFQGGLANTASFAYVMLLAIDRNGVPETD